MKKSPRKNILRKNILRKNGPRKNGLRKNDLQIKGPQKNRHLKKNLCRKWFSETSLHGEKVRWKNVRVKMAPRKMHPGKWTPDKTSPEKRFPRKTYPWKKVPGNEVAEKMVPGNLDFLSGDRFSPGTFYPVVVFQRNHFSGMPNQQNIIFWSLNLMIMILCPYTTSFHIEYSRISKYRSFVLSTSIRHLPCADKKYL